jgi:hypothetical protein
MVANVVPTAIPPEISEKERHLKNATYEKHEESPAFITDVPLESEMPWQRELVTPCVGLVLVNGRLFYS